MASILLIGTDHQDPSARRRTANALERVRPCSVSVECTPALYEYALTFNARIRALLGNRAAHGISDDAAEYVEYRLTHILRGDLNAAREYADRLKIPFAMADHTGTFRYRSEGVTDARLIETMRAATMDRIPVDQERADKKYDTYRHTLADLDLCQSFVDAAREDSFRLDGAPRDDYPARHILEMSRTLRGTHVHTCGAFHMYDDAQGETLYSILKNQAVVERALLRDFD